MYSAHGSPYESIAAPPLSSSTHAVGAGVGPVGRAVGPGDGAGCAVGEYASSTPPPHAQHIDSEVKSSSS